MWMGHKRIFTYKCRCTAKKYNCSIASHAVTTQTFQAKFFHLPFCSNACSYILTEYDSNFMRNVVALIIQVCSSIEANPSSILIWFNMRRNTFFATRLLYTITIIETRLIAIINSWRRGGRELLFTFSVSSPGVTTSRHVLPSLTGLDAMIWFNDRYLSNRHL